VHVNLESLTLDVFVIHWQSRPRLKPGNIAFMTRLHTDGVGVIKGTYISWSALILHSIDRVDRRNFAHYHCRSHLRVGRGKHDAEFAPAVLGPE